MVQIKKRKKKGQSTLEYILLITAVVLILITFLQSGGLFQNRYNDTLASATNGMVNMAERLKGSRYESKP